MKAFKGNKAVVLTAALALTGFMALTGCQSTHDHDGHDHSKHSHGSAAKAYPLKTCIVSDEKLDKDAFAFVHNGQELKTCCEGCREDFDKEPAKYLKKLAGK